MPDLTAAHARDLGDYLSLARRRWGWILMAALAGLLAATGYYLVAAESYVSTAKVLVKATSSDSGDAMGARTNNQINLDTEAQLVTSQPVATRAGELLDSAATPTVLARKVNVTVPPNTTVMAISFAGPTASEAQRGASAFAQAYLEIRQEDAQATLEADTDRLRGLIEKTREDIQRAGVAITRLTGPNESTDRAFMVARRSTLSSQLASYNAELAPLDGATAVPGEVIVDAQLPRRPADPNPFVLLPAGLMVGLVMGLGLAAWRERQDRRIHTGAEVERLFGLVPLSTLVARGRGRQLRLDHDVRAFYHALRANGPESGAVAALVGPDSSETAENIAYSVAVLAARSEAPTTYVVRPGSEVVEDRRRAGPARHEMLDLPDYESLGVVSDGEFRSSVLHHELAELSATRDFVILGLPHDDPSVDLPVLGRHLDVAVVVVRLGVTRRDSTAAVLSDLSKSGVERVFVITVDLGRRLRHVTSLSELFAPQVVTDPQPVADVTDGVEVEETEVDAAPAPPGSGRQPRARGHAHALIGGSKK